MEVTIKKKPPVDPAVTKVTLHLSPREAYLVQEVMGNLVVGHNGVYQAHGAVKAKHQKALSNLAFKIYKGIPKLNIS